MSAEAILLLQIVLLIFAGRLLGEIMQRLGQPSVMGQLLGGVLLGPSVLGAQIGRASCRERVCLYV